MSGTQLSADKSSKLLHKMISLAENSFTGDAIRVFWLGRLPNDVNKINNH